MGILEASVIRGQDVGKFGVVTTGPGWVNPLTRAINTLLVPTSRFGGVVSTGLGVLEFHPEDGETDGKVYEKMGEAANKLVGEEGVDVICLGCAGMEGLDEKIREALPKGKVVTVVDGVVAGVEILSGMLQ